MNVFILDKIMEKSAQMLDDAHLLAQINEGTQILMANYNRRRYIMSKPHKRELKWTRRQKPDWWEV